MQILNWIQFAAGLGLLIIGILIFAVQIIGIFKFRYVLNRMHAAAMGDTLGIGFCMVGLMILSGFNFTTLKMGLVIIFLWCASPVSSHLISRLEAMTNPNLDRFCELSPEVREALQEEDAKEEGERA